MKPILCLVMFTLAVAGAPAAPIPTSLQEALTFHASFDHGPDADFGPGDHRLFSAPSMKHPRTGTPGLPTNGAVSIAKGEGRFGDALRFHRKTPELVFFQGERNFSYAKLNWSGAVSFWLRLDPDTDLEAGFCDPLQITPREWNDGAFWVDFSKDERPRHFRLGAFADREVWDPNKRDYDALPASERPVVTVTRPPFSRDHWTHVVFTFANFNTGKKDGTATLYLDGKAQGTMSGWRNTVSWEPSEVIAMLGISYTGLLDELAFFNRSLTAAEVRQLFAVPGGVATLHP
jgi:Concanavalin A-like lectin/glucanases superfamily